MLSVAYSLLWWVLVWVRIQLAVLFPPPLPADWYGWPDDDDWDQDWGPNWPGQ